MIPAPHTNAKSFPTAHTREQQRLRPSTTSSKSKRPLQWPLLKIARAEYIGVFRTRIVFPDLTATRAGARVKIPEMFSKSLQRIAINCVGQALQGLASMHPQPQSCQPSAEGCQMLPLKPSKSGCQARMCMADCGACNARCSLKPNHKSWGWIEHVLQKMRSQSSKKKDNRFQQRPNKAC